METGKRSTLQKSGGIMNSSKKDATTLTYREVKRRNHD